MGYRITADLILVLHLLFVLFVLFGGLLCLHQIRWLWVHLPAMLWGVWVEWAGWVCPLTPLENHVRELASGDGYRESFVEHYLIPVMYPEQLSAWVQVVLGIIVLIINAVIYLKVFRKQRKSWQRVDEYHS